MRPFYQRTGMLLLVCARAAFVSAQGAPPPTESAEVQGLVVDATTGQPVQKAHVLLQKVQSLEAPVTARTDLTGQFVLLSVPPGRYRLWAERTGYLRGMFGARLYNSPGAILEVGAGVRLRDLTLRITPQSVIVGHVLNEDGEPVQDVHVQSLESSYVRGRRQLVAVQDAITNDLGEFRLHSLSPGRYLVSAAYRVRYSGQASAVTTGAREDETALEQTYAPTYFPNTSDPSAAATISLAPGEQVRGIDVILLRTATARIRGHVANTWGSRSNQNAMVALYPRDAGGIPSTDRNATTIPDAQGNFELRGVTPGSYLLTAQWGDGSARLSIEVWGSNINNVNLTIQPNLEVRGRLRLDSGGTIQLGDRRVLVSLQPIDALLSVIAAAAKPDGTFLLSNVPPDVYGINFAGLPEGYYVKDVRVGSEGLADGTLNLTAGSLAGALEVVLSRSGGGVEGAVTDADGRSFAGATVVLRPQPSRQHTAYLYRTTSTDQNGSFSLQGIAPGDYRLYAWEAMEGSAYLDPDFVHPYEGQSVSVSVGENSRTTLQLKVIPADGEGRLAKSP